MKALIVIEIPEDHFLVTANDLYERLKGYKCELNPMPEKKSIELACQKEDEGNDYGAGLIVGWNDCVREIENG